VVDHAARVARVSVTVVPGPPVRIGRVTVSGLEQVQEPFVRRRLAFKEGDPLTSTSIDAARQALVESGLFRTVRISYPREDLTATVLPVTVEVAERPHRSIGVGLGYSTNTGALAKVFWEHRNLFNEGERLRATGQLGQKDSLLELSFREPDFLRTDQALLASLKAQDEETDAYDRKSYGGSLAVERKLWDNWKGSLGVSYEHAFVTRHDIDTEEDLLGLPVTLSRDTTDNLLDPTRGSRLRLTATPYAPIGQQKTAFLVLSARHTFYQSLDEAGDIVGAGWVGLGSIPGADLADIPLSRRFYAGGGGSVRGFAYQHAGPLDRFNDPTGGSSLFEFGGEVRFKVTETIGIVPFLEAGSVYDDALPKFGQKLFWGAGIGVRYYTPIGPLRLDIATPLNPRRDDAKVQFYVSLGQAF
jgi:translocation and assembly module TamA